MTDNEANSEVKTFSDISPEESPPIPEAPIKSFDEIPNSTESTKEPVVEAPPEIKEPPTTDETPTPSGKIIRVKALDKEIELPEDTLIPIKVDGKIKEVKLSDIQTDVSGREYWSKKLQEVDQEKKAIQADLERIVPYVQEMQKVDEKLKKVDELNKKGDFFGGWVTIMEMAGLNIEEALPYYIKQTEALKTEWERRTPEQRRATFDGHKVKREREALEEERKKLDEKREEVTFNQNLVALQIEHQIPDKELREYWDKLHERSFFKENSITSLHDMAKATVGVILEHRLIQRVQDGIEVVDKKLLDDDPFVSRLTGVIKSLYPKNDFTKEDVQDIVKGVIEARKPFKPVEVPKVEAQPKPVATFHKNGSAPAEVTPSKEDTQTIKTPRTWDDLIEEF